MPFVAQGATTDPTDTRVYVRVTPSGPLIDPDPGTLTLQINDPDGDPVLTVVQANLTREALGIFSYTWITDVDQAIGPYAFLWDAEVEGAELPTAVDEVEVIPAGTLSSTVVSLAQVRALVSTPLGDSDLQDVIGREEAYLESIIGPLTGTRTETFYLYRGMAREPVMLRRPASVVTVTDNAVAVDDAEVRLLADGRTVRRLAVDGDWGGLWTGPVVATYSPNDELLVARVLIDMIRLASTTGPFASETMGSYSYTRGSGASAAPTRRGLAESLLRRPTATSIRISDPPVWPWGWRT